MTTWLLGGLIVLLLVSPCKVRNHIQAVLGHPQTEVTNKSLATLTVTCEAHPVVTNQTSLAKNHGPYFPAILNNNLYKGTFETVDLPSSSTAFDSKRNQSAAFIPYYILYQNFKDFLA